MNSQCVILEGVADLSHSAFQRVKRMFVSKPEVKYFKTGLPKLRHLQFESRRVLKRVTWERGTAMAQWLKCCAYLLTYLLTYSMQQSPS